MVVFLSVAGALTACGSSVGGPAAPPAVTGTNAVNIDGAIVSRGGLVASCQGGDHYWMSAGWDDSPESYTLSIFISPYHGPGTYVPKDQAPNLPVSELTLTRLDTAKTDFRVSGNAGSVTVDHGEKSGRFDASFSTNDGGQFRVYGNWSCTTLE